MRLFITILFSVIIGTILFVSVKSQSQTFDSGYTVGVSVMIIFIIIYHLLKK